MYVKSQSQANNTSTIEYKVYIVNTDPEYQRDLKTWLNSSSATVSFTFNGTTISVSPKSFKVTGGGSGSTSSFATIASGEFTHKHNTNGTAGSPKYSMTVDPDIVYISNQPAFSFSGTITNIPTIARNPVITNTPSPLMGQPIPFTISKGSTSFTTTISIEYKYNSTSWTRVSNLHDMGTKTNDNLTLSDAQWGSLLDRVLVNSVIPESFQVRMIATSYSGSTKIGNTATKTINLIRPNYVSVAFTSDNDFNIDTGTLDFRLDNRNKAVLNGLGVTVTVSDNTGNNIISAKPYDGTVNWANGKTFSKNYFTEAEKTVYKNLLGSSDRRELRVRARTTLFGRQITHYHYHKYYRAGISNITVSSSNLSITNTNSTVASLNLGTNVVVADKSSISLTIPAGLFTTNYTAELSSLTISAGTYSHTASISGQTIGTALVYDMGIYKASYNDIITVRVQDTWGATAQKQLSIKLRAYSPPSIRFSYSRADLTVANVVLDSGTYSTVPNASGVTTNSITSITTYVENSIGFTKNQQSTVTDTGKDGRVDSFGNKTFSVTGLVSTDSYNIRVVVVDKLGTHTMGIQTIASWSPLMQINHITNSIGLLSSTDSQSNAVTVGKELRVIEGGITSPSGYNPISIPVNADLNDYTTPGFYFTGANATAATWSNKASSRAGSLIVLKNAGVTQYYQEYNVDGAKLFFRNQYGSWGAWKEIITGSPDDFIAKSLTLEKSEIVSNGYFTSVKNTFGYIDIGPANAFYAHLYTDRPSFYFNKEIYVSGNKTVHVGNYGHGNGIDADKLDGKHASDFMAAGDKHIIQVMTQAQYNAATKDANTVYIIT